MSEDLKYNDKTINLIGNVVAPGDSQENYLDLGGTSSDYVELPEGTWFEGDFTIEGWVVYARSFNQWSRLLDFGNGSRNDNVVFSLSGWTTGKPALTIYDGSSGQNLVSETALELNKWSHIAVTLQGSTASIYIDGERVAWTDSMKIPNGVLRTKNYLGRSNWDGDGYADALFDEVKIWDTARTVDQIKASYNDGEIAPLTNPSEEANLLAYYNFNSDSNQSDTITDSTDKGNDGLRNSTTIQNNTATTISLTIDELLYPEATIPAGATLSFENGAIAVLSQTVTLNNETPTTDIAITLTQAPNSIELEATADLPASLPDGTVIVTTAYDPETRTVGLRLEGDTQSVTLAAGQELSFSNGVIITLDSLVPVGLTNTAETTVSVIIDENRITSDATLFYEYALGQTLNFTNTDDDTAGVTLNTFETATKEGFSNNFFSVVLDSEPTAEVAITLNPVNSDDNIRIEDEFAGESHTITFDATNWDIPQAIEIFAVDDNDVEYLHTSEIELSLSSNDDVYNTLTPPENVKVFIEDNDRPTASIKAVAGAIENYSPGYFVITLDTPAPSGFDGTGIAVNYTIGGTADADGDQSQETDDLQPLTGSVRIAPGKTQSPLIAFPIDDFKAEGIDLIVDIVDTDTESVTINSGVDDGTVPLQINVDSFTFSGGVSNIVDGDSIKTGTIQLQLDPSTNKTSILGQGTTLLFGDSEVEATVSETVIIKSNEPTDVNIRFLPDTDIPSGTQSVVYQQITLPKDTVLDFDGSRILVKNQVDVNNKSATAVNVILPDPVTPSVLISDGISATLLTDDTLVVDGNSVNIDDDGGEIALRLNNDTGTGNITLSAGTTLNFDDGSSVIVSSDTQINAGSPTSVRVTPVPVSSSVTVNDGTLTTLQGETLTATLDDSEFYLVSPDANSAALTIADNDKPGVRIVTVGDGVTVTEGDSAGTQFFVSLLSQPEAAVTIDVAQAAQSVATIEVVSYSGTDLTLRVTGSGIDSLTLPGGTTYDFTYTDGSIASLTLNADTLISSEGTTLTITEAEGDNFIEGQTATALYGYSQLDVATESLTFDSNDWFQLKPVTVLGIDDNVVETGDTHTSSLKFTVNSIDPTYSSFEVANQSVDIIDRTFDSQETAQSISEGFLALQDSLDNVTLPIIGNLKGVAPSFIDLFLGDLANNIRKTDNLTAESLSTAFNDALSDNLGDSGFTFEITDLSTDNISFLLGFGRDFTKPVVLNTDLGLPALNLGLESEGFLDFSASYDIALGFGISKAEGFYLNTDETGFTIDAGMNFSNPFRLTGNLGFLQIEAANGTKTGTGVNAEFGINIKDPRQDLPFVIESVSTSQTGTNQIGFAVDTGALSQELKESLGNSLTLSAGTELKFSDGTIATLSGEVTLKTDGTVLTASIQDDLGISIEADETSSFTTNGIAIPLIVKQSYNSGTDSIGLAIDTGKLSPELKNALGSGLTLTKGTELKFSNGAIAELSDAVTLKTDGVSQSVELVDPAIVVNQKGTFTPQGVDNRFTLPELIEARDNFGFSDFVKYGFTPESGATLDLDILTTVSGNTQFPSFGFNLSSDSFTLGNYNNNGFGDLNLQFNDITLDLGGFVTDFLSPVIKRVNDVVEPIQPVIDALTTEITLLEKVGLAEAFDRNGDGSATIIEVAESLASGAKKAPKYQKFFDAVQGVIALSESLKDLEDTINSGENLSLGFGDYTFELAAGTEDVSQQAVTENPDSDKRLEQVDKRKIASDAKTPSGAQNTNSKLTNKVNNFFSALDNVGITLDIVEEPLNLVKLFLGQDIDLVTWDVPELDIGFTIGRSFPIAPPIFGSLSGGLSAYSDLVFGFDTVGFSNWKETDFALAESYRIFDGFYLSDVDPETGVDVDELELAATIEAGVSATAVVASVEATGGIQANAGLDVIDIGEYTGESDGRIRGSEIISRISNPLSLFEFAGALEAYLAIAVKVGLDLGFWEQTVTVYEEELARETLFEFTLGGAGSSGAASGSYIVGSTVFFDANFNGTWDENEPFSITDSYGRYFLDIPVQFDLNRDGVIDESEGQLIVKGGIDSSSGLPSGDLFALPGSSAITPLTSLVATLHYQEGLTVDAAETLVKAQIGLDQNLSLNLFDALDSIGADEQIGLDTYVAHIKVQALLNSFRAFLDGWQEADPNTEVDPNNLQNVLSAVAQFLVNRPSSEVWDFNDPLIIQSFLQGFVQLNGITATPEQLTVTAQVIATSSQFLDQVIETSPYDRITEIIPVISSIKRAVQGELPPIVQQMWSNTITATEALVALDAVLNQNYILVDGEVSTFGNRSVQVTSTLDKLNEASPDGAQFVVELSEPAPNQGVTVYYNLSGTATSGEDYTVDTETLGELYIAPGQIQATLDLTPINDGEVESLETITLNLQSVGEGFSIVPGANAVGLLKLEDDESSANTPQTGETIVGTDGNDGLAGTANNDHIMSKAGDDVIIGGDGQDHLQGNFGADNIAGNAGNDFIEGGSGNDTLFGNEGADQILGNSGDDHIQGNQGNDVLKGGTGNDVLEGNDDNDWLVGDAGEDILSGGFGIDYLHGSDGSDAFFFSAPNQGQDFILDFDPAEGDKIQISAPGFNNPTLTDFVFLAGQLKYQGETIALIQNDGPTYAYFPNLGNILEIVDQPTPLLPVELPTPESNLVFGIALAEDISTPESTILDDIIERGFIQLGLTDQSTELDQDFARILAAAIFGDASKVEITTTSEANVLTAVAEGTVDLGAGQIGVNLIKDATLGIDFGPIYFYQDGNLNNASPQGVAFALPENDSQWADVVRWITYVPIQAEEYGITSANIDQLIADNTDDNSSNDSEVGIRRFLGIEGDLGASLGLPDNFAVNIIKQVGNYGEIYDRHFPDQERNRNLLWNDEGLLYALPFSGSSSGTTLPSGTTTLNVLDAVQERGTLRFGTSLGSAAFAIENTDGTIVGMDADLGYAIAAAVLGDASNIEFVDQAFGDSFANTADNIVDISATSTTHNLVRDADLGVDFGPRYLYTGQGILVRNDSGINVLPDLNGRRIGFWSPGTAPQNLSDALEPFDATFIQVDYPTLEAVFNAYEADEVDAVVTDLTLLAPQIERFANPEDHRLLADTISKEPLAMVIDENQSEWGDAVRWIYNSLVQAEEYGITQANIDDFIAINSDDDLTNDSNTAIRQFLGLEGNLGEALGLSNDFAVNAIKAVGNYGEIYDRHFDSESLQRDSNELVSNFGLQYALPAGTAVAEDPEDDEDDEGENGSGNDENTGDNGSDSNNDTDDNPTPPQIDLEDSDEQRGVIALQGALALLFKLTQNQTASANQLVVFEVTDSQGSVTDTDGSLITPGTASFNRDRYLNAILNTGNPQAVLSTLDGDDDSPLAALDVLTNTLEVSLDFEANQRLGFFLIVDGSIDDLQRNTSALEVFFSTQNGAALSNLTENGFQLDFGNEAQGIFDDLSFTVTVGTSTANIFITPDRIEKVGKTLTISVDNTPQFVEGFDFRNLDLNQDGLVDVEQSLVMEVTLYREAAFDNTIGFYAVDALTGAVENIAPTAENRVAYAQRAIGNAIGQLSAPADQTTTSQILGNLNSGTLVLPFLIVNSETANEDYSNVYFPFLALNSDGQDHFQLLGNGLFGIEDLPGAQSDNDFDDVIIQITGLQMV